MSDETRAIAFVEGIERSLPTPIISQLMPCIQAHNEVANNHDLVGVIINSKGFAFASHGFGELFFSFFLDYQESIDFENGFDDEHFPVSRIIAVYVEDCPSISYRYILIPDTGCKVLLRVPAFMYADIVGFLEGNKLAHLILCGYNLDIDKKAWQRIAFGSQVLIEKLDDRKFDAALKVRSLLRGGEFAQGLLSVGG